MTTFPTRIYLHDDDYTKPIPGAVVLTAPRPLYGVVVEIPNMMGFQVDVSGLSDELLEQNRRLDAYQIVFVSKSEAIEWTKAKATEEYGHDVGDHPDDVWLETFSGGWAQDYLAAVAA